MVHADYHILQCWPFPFVSRWRVYRTGFRGRERWIATFKNKDDAIEFVYHKAYE